VILKAGRTERELDSEDLDLDSGDLQEDAKRAQEDPSSVPQQEGRVRPAPQDTAASGALEVPSWAPNAHPTGAEDGNAAAAVAAQAAAGAEAGEEAAAEVAGKGAGRGMGDVKQEAIDEHSLVSIVQQCQSKKAAKACLEHMHTCMAPYKMGDISRHKFSKSIPYWQRINELIRFWKSGCTL
jgi:hypothetical protein